MKQLHIKSKFLVARVTPETFNQFSKLSKQRQISPSNLLRFIVDTFIKKNSLPTLRTPADHKKIPLLQMRNSNEN